MRPFIDPDYQPSEVSSKLLFGGNRLERLSEERDDDCIEWALKDPAARILGMAKGRVVIAFEKDAPRGLLTQSELEQFSPKWQRAVLMGYDGGAPRLAVPLGIDPNDENLELPEPYKPVDYRSIAAQNLLNNEELGQIAQGAAYLAWHATSRFCGSCGNETEMRGGGVKRHCASCERDHFPRTDPVVIMLITKGDKCLLGRSPNFLPGMYSALAGFVESGESIEMAVRRETFEESGIRVGDVKYHATQPWPFPHTLMIGCYGEALDEEIMRDEGELEDCRWFTRDEIHKILAGTGEQNDDGSPKYFMPPRLAIANRLVADWAENSASD